MEVIVCLERKVSFLSVQADVVVAGGGASGILAAILCARNQRKVIILEQKEKIGKKILATGNGKCNYTNLEQCEEYYHSLEKGFVELGLQEFGPREVISFFEELGIYPKNKNGYIYPYSEQAASLLQVFEMELQRLNVLVVCQEQIKKIEKKKHNFFVKTNKNEYQAKNVIMAMGGQASPKLGSDGSGFYFASKIGHAIEAPVPALIGLKCQEDYFSLVSGVRTEAEVSVYIEGVKECVAKNLGELQLTNYGVSGIPVFQVSRFAARALHEGKKVFVCIDYMPHLKKEELVLLLEKRFFCEGKTAEQALVGLFSQKLIPVFLQQGGIRKDMKANKIKAMQIVQLATKIKGMRNVVYDTNGFENAQVTAGGVATKEIEKSTMESKIISGLYFVGEIMDVDGICGGYNLQWCWSSAYLAAKAIG